MVSWEASDLVAAAQWITARDVLIARRAVHEAGHAVAALALGAVVNEVVVVRGDSFTVGVHTSYTFPEDESDEIKARDLELAPIGASAPYPSKNWVATRVGGVGSILGLAVVDIQIPYDVLMADTHDDDAHLTESVALLEPGLRDAWVARRYAETWAFAAAFPAGGFGHR